MTKRGLAVVGVMSVLVLILGAFIGPSMKKFVIEGKEDGEDLVRVLWSLAAEQDPVQERSLIQEKVELPTVIVDVPVDGETLELEPPFIEDVPKHLFPEPPASNSLENDVDEGKLRVKELRNGWDFVYWFVYTGMMQDKLGAQEYVKDNAVYDDFLNIMFQEDLLVVGATSVPLGTHLVSFSSDAPEEGITVQAKINFVKGSPEFGEGIPVTVVITFESGRWWITSIRGAH